MTPKAIVAVTLAAVLATGIVGSFGLQTATAQMMKDKEGDSMSMMKKTKGDLTAPSGDKPFGGDKIGTYSAKVTPRGTQIHAKVTEIDASEGHVLEGWLVDAETGYKLSLGQFSDNGTLKFSQRMVNPYIYNMLVITEEPAEDSDPNPATPVGGATLPEPFGQ